MGIELLEITFRLEKRFGFRLKGPERLAAFHNTAGTLSNFVWQRMNGAAPGVPDLPELYERVYAAAHVAPAGGRLYNTQLSDLLGESDLDRPWGQFQNRLGLALPPLACDRESGRPELPAEFATVSRLVQWIVDHHPHRVNWVCAPAAERYGTQVDGISREDCWLAIREILADVMMVDPEQVVPDSHLVSDLGMA